MVVLCMLLTMLCFLLNGVVLEFYFKKKEEVVCLIYSLLSLAGRRPYRTYPAPSQSYYFLFNSSPPADLVVGVGSCLTVTCLVVYLCTDTRDDTWDYVAPQMQYLCYLAFFVATLAIRSALTKPFQFSLLRKVIVTCC